MVKRMQGVPAHIVRLKPDRWIYNNTCRMYDKGICLHHKGRCTGATYCIMYEEKIVSKKKKNKKKATKKQNKSLKLKNKKLKKQKEKKQKQRKRNKLKRNYKELEVGNYLNHKKLGRAKIVKNNWDQIELDFNGDKRVFKLEFLIKNKLIE